MGSYWSSSQNGDRIIGINEYENHIRLKDVWESRKDIENIVKYSREFLRHHFVLPTKETNFEAEIFYAKKLIAMIKPYSPRGVDIPEFQEKPPPFGETKTVITLHEYKIFLTETIEYVSVILSMIKIIPFTPGLVNQN